MKDFDQFIGNLNLKYFTPKEVLGTVGSVAKGNVNAMPHPDLWDNIIPTIRLVDKVREMINKPIIINSSYRSPGYNRVVGGARDSWHMKFNALDIRAVGMSPKELYNVLLDLRNRGEFKGGLSLYNTFVHVDTRGYNANW